MTVGEAITVLMVEDDPGDARLIRTLLDRTALKPLHLTAVDRVSKGVELLRHNGKVDVVLLDVSLPDTRAGTLDSLRRIKEAAPDLPLILLTGIDDEDLAVRAVREGAQDYLVKKEVDAGLLGRAIRYAIERKRAEMALRESQERYELAVNGAKDGLWDWDLRQDRIYFSPRWKSMLGFEEGEIGEHPSEWFDRVHPDDLPAVRLALSEHLTGRAPAFESEHRILHAGGGYRWVLTRGLAVRNGGDVAYRMAGSQSDITDRKTAEERLLHDAFHDPLTGLPNRALFMDRLGMAIAHAKRRLSYTYAVLFIDLDRFKNVNDSLGHSAGDELLIAVARRLESCLRPGDTVARLGGDEFTILLDEVADVDHAVQVAQRMHREMARPFRVQGCEVFVTMSLGITVGAGGDYDRPEDVLRDADTAMYGAKTSGKSRDAVFDPNMHDRAVALLQLETDLRRAVERSEFEIHYQPIISLACGKIDAFEALLRWRHPRRGLLCPDSFVPVAEDTGLIVPIGWWVLHEACTQLADWQSRSWGGEHLAVTVNLSGKQFMQADLVERIEDILFRSGIRSGSLRLEITESTIMEQAEDAVEKLLALRRLGVKLYIDDFGTGYSSLSYLHRLPVDALKIDRSFISEMDSASGDERSEIVGTIVTLARTLRMDVAAEGIETAEQVTRLRALSCHFGQGYFFSKPLGRMAAAGLIQAGASW
ncbi:MAG TPA: EAL domain-containing protein [Thermoanaerobaculia bacterium]|jgi:diguanylate cyclase (GGDEF)-like protein/PAS domain S-box-containing protein|nr:EAL domain-containing protein [Thermoanaerobaculia bacterium]